MNTPAEIIKACASDKLQLNRSSEDLSLVEVRSNGERSIYKDNDISVPTALSLNGRIFVSPKDHLDALVSNEVMIPNLFNLDVNFDSQTPLAEQEVATEGIDMDIEMMGTKELAYHITMFDWDLFWAVHEYELLYHTFGRHHFGKVSLIFFY